MPFQQNFRQSGTEENTTPLGYSQAVPNYHRSWPDAVAFREAIQLPQSSFADSMLREANVSLDRRGLPVAYSGRFAIVFRLNGTDGEKWAVRCFTSGLDAEERRARYYLIARHFDELGDIVVPFRYIDKGISVNGEWYPVLAMPWVGAEPLGRFVEKRLREPETLRRLAGVLSGLQEKLENLGIAHGDWQHDNLLVTEGGAHVTLVDYDGMYVPELEGRWSTEAGHPNYQHPARTAEQFGPDLDRFSCLVIQTALLGLANDPDLWYRFSDGESLLFKKSDFLNPSSSTLFQTLRSLAEKNQDQLLADSIACLDDACRAPVGSILKSIVPPIESVVVKERKPAASTNSTNVPVSSGASLAYAQGPWYATDPSGKRWWQETVTLSSVPTGARATAQTHEVYNFIDRLMLPETLAEERKNLWHARIVVPLALSLIILSLVWIATRAHFFPFYVFFWMFNLGNIGYARWPRRKIYDELNTEILKMQQLVEKRKQSLANRRANMGLTGNLSDFVADKLRKQSINGIMSISGLRQSILGDLRTAGIDSALQLQQRTAIPGVSTQEMTLLRDWVDRLTMNAQDEYRRLGGSQANAANDLRGLQGEIADYEREVERLQREKDAFPDHTFSAYLRRLLGADRSGNNAATPAASP